MKIKIEMDLDPEHEAALDDDNHGGTGMNEDSHIALQDALNSFGTDIEVTALETR